MYYEMLPAAGQVMCWHLSRLLPEAAARRVTVWWAEVRKGCPHEKWLRTQSMCIVQAGFPPLGPAVGQPAGPLLLNLLKCSKKGEVLASPEVAKCLPQPQSAERLFGWQDGNQGKAAKEKAKEQQARKDRTRKNIYIAKAHGRYSTEV